MTKVHPIMPIAAIKSIKRIKRDDEKIIYFLFATHKSKKSEHDDSKQERLHFSSSHIDEII